MDFEKKAWYELLVLLAAAAASMQLIEAAGVRGDLSFAGLALFWFCLDGIDRLVRATVGVAVILFKPKAR